MTLARAKTLVTAVVVLMTAAVLGLVLLSPLDLPAPGSPTGGTSADGHEAPGHHPPGH